MVVSIPFTAHGNNSCTHQPKHGWLLVGNQLALVLHVFALVFIIDDAYPCSVNICQKHHKLALFLQTVYKCNSLLRYNTPVTGITVQQLCNYSWLWMEREHVMCKITFRANYANFNLGHWINIQGEGCRGWAERFAKVWLPNPRAGG